jgi:hypothetical protein
MTNPTLLDDDMMDLASCCDVLPYCVYHQINTEEGDYRTYLSGPVISRDDDGKIMYACQKPLSVFDSQNPYGKWLLAFTFYAINPMLRPIPYGMGIFCAKKRNTFPWDTQSIKLVYDPYDTNDQCVYFIAYTKPVPWTKPLFVHAKGYFSDKSTSLSQAVFVSWNANPPISEYVGEYVKTKDPKDNMTLPIWKWKGKSRVNIALKDLTTSGGDYMDQIWRHGHIFPFFVLSPEVFGKDYWNIKFICHNANCLPYNPNNNYIENEAASVNTRFFGKGSKPYPRSLRNCVVRCNQLMPDELDAGHPFGLVGMIKKELKDITTTDTSLETKKELKDIKTPDTAKTKTSAISPIVVAVLFTILVVILGLLLYFTLQKK